MTTTVNKITQFSGHQASVYALEQAHLPNLLYSAGSDRVIARWDLAQQAADNFAVKMTLPIYKLKYLAQHNMLIAGTGIGHVYVIDLIEKKEIKNLLLHPKATVFEIEYDADLNILISAAADGTIAVVYLPTFELIAQTKLGDTKIRSLQLIPEEKLLLATSSDGYIYVLELPTLKQVHRFFAHDLSANKVIKHPTKNIILSGGRDAHLNIYEWPSCNLLHKIAAHNFAIYDIAFSANNGLFATASRDKTIKIWDAENYQFLYRIDKEKNDGHINSVNKLLWSNFNNYLVSAGDDRAVMVWEIKQN